MTSPQYICLLSWIPLRASASSTSEMVSSLLFGETCSLIQNHGDWLEVTTNSDHYLGFIPESYLHPFSSVHETYTVCIPYQTAAISSDNNIKINLSPGSLLPPSGVINVNETAFTIPQENKEPNAEKMLLQFLNAPYLWGGRSIFGLDCSGLTQVHARLLGISLPRDAYQQAELGETISYENQQYGDLAFFANHLGKITHVGVITNQNQIIHASGMVRQDLLTSEGIVNTNTQKLTHTLAHIKRMT